MAKAPKGDNKSAELQVMTLRTGMLHMCIKGVSPLILHAMSDKAKHELLLPKGRKTAAERAENLKHNPIEEYRSSVYAHADDEHSTRIMFPAGGFKKAAMTAALDLPGMKKTEIGRLLWVKGATVDIYGIPQMLMSVVRSADINRTPDIRTRAIIPAWACRVSVQYVKPKLADQQVANLFAAAGMIAGIGDGRQEKGALNYGQFELCSEDDPEFMEIVKNGCMTAQDIALQAPSCHDLESDRLFAWFNEEVAKMGERAKPTKVAVTA